ncbi:fimbrial protein [Cupriavidus basilensis]|uniref:fimbrial protein n=1 Tax=Cupriavidus basilensis TaxID=68895 RepID=UPI0007514FF4|nr:fimbrial protein [Cupriavidus basilensis]
MKRTIVASLATTCVALAALTPSLSQAFDGQIDFTGSITDVSCTINGHQPGGGNHTLVDLGTINPNVFTGLNARSTAVPFSLALGGGTNCIDGRKALVSFDTGSSNIDPNTGNLILVGTGAAKGVQVEVSDAGNGASGKIPLNVAQTTPQTATISGNTATLTYSAVYVQTAGSITPGAANTFIRYTMVYN